MIYLEQSDPRNFWKIALRDLLVLVESGTKEEFITAKYYSTNLFQLPKHKPAEHRIVQSIAQFTCTFPSYSNANRLTFSVKRVYICHRSMVFMQGNPLI